MFGINWSDPSTYWLNVVNLALGVVVVLCLGAVAFAVVQELYTRRKKSVALDREYKELMASFDDGHAFNVPGLGMTMADGGEPNDPDKNGKR